LEASDVQDGVGAKEGCVSKFNMRFPFLKNLFRRVTRVVASIYKRVHLRSVIPHHLQHSLAGHAPQRHNQSYRRRDEKHYSLEQRGEDEPKMNAAQPKQTVT
jgi:hypothetical protein